MIKDCSEIIGDAGRNGETSLGSINEASEIFLTDADLYTKAIGATPVIIDDVNDGVVSGLAGQSALNGTITINKKGLYRVVFNISFSLNGGAKVDGSVYVNGAPLQRAAFERDIANANDVGAASAHGLYDFDGVSPIEVDLRVSADNERLMSVQHMNLSFFGIGSKI